MSKASRKRGIAPVVLKPGADPLDQPLIAQRGERAPAARGQLLEIGLERFGRLMDPAVEVVDQQEVDPVDSEALQAVLERPHHAVVAVVEHGLELETADPWSPIERAGLRGPPQEPSDLGRQHVVLPRTAGRACGRAGARPGRGRTRATCRNSAPRRPRPPRSVPPPRRRRPCRTGRRAARFRVRSR